MAVEANNGDQNSYAALQSPAMRQASAECVLVFFYHMYGEGKINAIVHIKGDVCLQYDHSFTHQPCYSSQGQFI